MKVSRADEEKISMTQNKISIGTTSICFYFSVIKKNIKKKKRLSAGKRLALGRCDTSSEVNKLPGLFLCLPGGRIKPFDASECSISVDVKIISH